MRRGIAVLMSAGATALGVAAACVPDYHFGGGQEGGDAASDGTSPPPNDARTPMEADVDAGPPSDAGDAAAPARVPVPAGTYSFHVEDSDGALGAVRSATLTRGFAIDPYEVTVERFAAWIDAGSPNPADGESLDPNGPYATAMVWHADWNDMLVAADYRFGGMYDCNGNSNDASPCAITWGKNPSFPITYVNWYQAAAMCWFEHARLLTDTEWQIVATGKGQDNVYPWGKSPGPDCQHAVADYDRTQCGFPLVVGTAARGATIDGVYDLSGSVAEWVWDLDGDYPLAPTTDYAGRDYVDAAMLYDDRLQRGGSYQDYVAYNPDYITTYGHYGHPANVSWGDLGFRCAKTM